MFTLLCHFFFPNRSRITQEGSQGLWDYPQPTPEASLCPKQHQEIIFCFLSPGPQITITRSRRVRFSYSRGQKTRKMLAGRWEKGTGQWPSNHSKVSKRETCLGSALRDHFSNISLGFASECQTRDP